MKFVDLDDLKKTMKEYKKPDYHLVRDCHIYYSYILGYNNNLLESTEKLKWLYKEKGLTENTVKEMLIGIDDDSNWCIPMYRYVTDAEATIVGQQKLSPDFKIVDYISHVPVSLTMINEYSEKTVTIVIVNDHLEGYTLFQYLEEQGLVDLFHIVTPMYGVNSLYSVIQTVDFCKYEEFYLMLHGYKGEVMTNKIISDYPMFSCLGWYSDFESFNKRYVESLKYSQNNQNKYAFI